MSEIGQRFATLSLQTKLAELQSINRAVNDEDLYVEDLKQFHTEEYWANADETGRGDCEDLAEAKYTRLRNLGWPQEILNFGFCMVGGLGHAVLIVTLEPGDYILDNRYTQVMKWTRYPYKWIQRTVNGNFNEWVKVTA